MDEIRIRKLMQDVASGTVLTSLVTATSTTDAVIDGLLMMDLDGETLPPLELESLGPRFHQGAPSAFPESA